MSTMIDHFKEAMRLLIAAPIHLTGSYFAFRYSTGDLIRSENIKTANCFCAMGALYKAGSFPINQPIPDEYVHALGFKLEGDVINWNDRSDKNEVLTRFAETINKLEKM